jgi:hypothetical protein
MIMKIILIIVLINLCQSESLYNTNSNVIKLTASNFQNEVVNSQDIWLVEFYGNIFIYL